MTDNSWSSYIGSYAGSAADVVGGTAKSVWNSEALASGSEKVKSGVTAAANGAKAAWNSEAMVTGTDAVKSSATAAANGVKTWWTTPKEIQSEEESAQSARDSYRGTIVAMSKNASKYVVQTTGRSSNIVNIFDKSSRSALGNPRWWCRFDRAHGNVKFPHINMNSKLTGIPDPHIPISGATAKAAGYLGKVAEVANDVAPILATVTMAYEGYKVAQEVKKDYDNGTTRNTIERVSTVTGTYASGFAGASAGASIGTWFLPGIGTIFGALIGGGFAGYYGGKASQFGAEKTLEYYKWDTVQANCPRCSANYEYRKYRGDDGGACPSNCSHSKL